MSAVTTNTDGNDRKPDWLEVVRQQVTTLHYGLVQIVVHGSKVVQIEKTERVRMDSQKAK